MAEFDPINQIQLNSTSDSSDFNHKFGSVRPNLVKLDQMRMRGLIQWECSQYTIYLLVLTNVLDRIRNFQFNSYFSISDKGTKG